MKVRDVCLIAHAKGRDAIKSVAPEVRVGMTLDLQDFSPGAGGEALYRRVYDESRAPFYEAARNDDFLGVQPYMRYTFGPEGLIPADPAGERNQWGQTCPPDVAATVAREAHAAAGVPIIVTENGIDTLDDAQRIRFTRASVEALSAEVDRGLPLHGYIHWTLMDDYSWSAGYAPRFGMCSVNRTTFRRTPKPSLAAYRALIGDMKRKHRWASGKSVAANPFQENHHA
ncbi:MAG: glycoside hydrolase family 1 protein [Reyranella sp.]|nr:glycoside hydrolase family 1 protein [Reyranella sp.]